MQGFVLPAYVSQALEKLRDAGEEAYAVGGCVRDMLRGVTPHDYDVTTSARPERIKEIFREFRTVDTGIRHGTVTVVFDGQPLEITTYRVDGGYTDGRHPDGVTFTRSLQEDAARRDFTVNAMAYAPGEGVIDYFGGQADLRAGVLRAVGEPVRRFTEDALRILRAMRFSAVLGFRIEETTAAAMHALKERLSCVSAERIREEFVKLLCGKDAGRVLREYADVAGVFLPEIIPMIGFDQHSPHHIYDIYEHTLHALDAAPAEPELRLAALLHDIGKPACFFLGEDGCGHFYGHAAKSVETAEDILTRLKFDNATKDRVTRLIKYHDLVPDTRSRQLARMRGKEGEEFLFSLFALMRADHAGQTASYDPAADITVNEAEAYMRALIAAEPRLDLRSLAVNGGDLIAKGVRPGKELGQMLQKALDAVTEQKIPNEKDAILSFLFPAPVETERKFLIRYPDEAVLQAQDGWTESRIAQTYLACPPGVTERVRMREYENETVYSHTVKKRLSALSALETEEKITEDAYKELLSRADKTRQTVYKRRVVIPYHGHKLEIDLYPFWKNQAVLEIELGTEDESYDIPPYLTVLRDVSADKKYKNASLAVCVPPEDAEGDDRA